MLVVPPTSEHLRTIRFVAADAGGRAGFDYEEIEDLRLAVDELASCLMSGTDHHVVVSFCVFDDRIVVRGTTRGRHGSIRHDLPELSSLLVDAITDHWHFEAGADEAWFFMSKESQPSRAVGS